MGVWATFQEVLSLCWQRRALAAKYIAVPLALNIALTLIIDTPGGDDAASIAIDLAIALVSMLVFAPFCIAWYRMVLFGHQAIDFRPVFTLGKLEWRFFGWQVLLTILPIIVAMIVVLVGGGVIVAVSAINAYAGVVVGVIGVVAGFLLFLWVISRWSITLAMVAAGHDASLDLAWSMSRRVGWLMVWVQVLLFLLVGFAFMLLVIPVASELMAASKAKTDPVGFAAVYTNVLTTLFGAVILWLLSTMFALVYKRIEYIDTNNQLPALEPAPQPSP
jgi:hypothetical protein